MSVNKHGQNADALDASMPIAIAIGRAQVNGHSDVNWPDLAAAIEVAIGLGCASEDDLLEVQPLGDEPKTLNIERLKEIWSCADSKWGGHSPRDYDHIFPKPRKM
ncbi:hypothetical protein [Lysobacter capsici]|uniref:hypothetical protein n=1 Tax=Lysobacter capsici TaxID=435897 RepID=UPI001C003B43|nr:hypothetical protein [Lysobacter capsici]QWF18138.1 hypothetical protein KME82_05060 [Lysobacter capsici]